LLDICDEHKTTDRKKKDIGTRRETHKIPERAAQVGTDAYTNDVREIKG
jgi:hypothetical protein